jgi:hypothetical protein
MYYKAMHLFTTWEVRNAEKASELFTAIMGINSTIIQKDTNKWEQAD